MRSVVPMKQKPRAQRKQSSKPAMERRRRARINACLAQLHTLLTQARAMQICRRSRLEKADILELTVRHIKSLTSKKTDAIHWGQFYSGYRDCAREASRFLSVSTRYPSRSTAHLHPSDLDNTTSKTGNVNVACLHHRRSPSNFPATPALCTMYKPPFGVTGNNFSSAPNPRWCPAVLQNGQLPVSNTDRGETGAQMASQDKKTEHQPGIGDTGVWRPW